MLTSCSLINDSRSPPDQSKSLPVSCCKWSNAGIHLYTRLHRMPGRPRGIQVLVDPKILPEPI